MYPLTGLVIETEVPVSFLIVTDALVVVSLILIKEMVRDPSAKADKSKVVESVAVEVENIEATITWPFTVMEYSLEFNNPCATKETD